MLDAKLLRCIPHDRQQMRWICLSHLVVQPESAGCVVENSIDKSFCRLNSASSLLTHTGERCPWLHLEACYTNLLILMQEVQHHVTGQQGLAVPIDAHPQADLAHPKPDVVMRLRPRKCRATHHILAAQQFDSLVPVHARVGYLVLVVWLTGVLAEVKTVSRKDHVR